MSVAKAFETSYNLFKAGQKHKLFKQNGQWLVTVEGSKK